MEVSTCLLLSKFYYFFLLTPKRDKSVVNIWMHGCTGHWRENNQFSPWAVLLTNSQQIKRCTITYYWLFSGVGQGGCSPSHRLSSNMPPFMFTWVALHSVWLSCEILQIELAKGKTASSVLATRRSASIWPVLMFCTKGSSVMLQYLAYKGLIDFSDIWGIFWLWEKHLAKQQRQIVGWFQSRLFEAWM